MRETTEQPFWVDGPEIRSRIQHRQQNYWTVVGYINFAVNTFILLGVITYFVYKLGGSILASIYFIFIAIAMIAGLILRRKIWVEQQDITDIQERARERTGASVMGSAVHVAGHPILQREQPVVLALVGDQLQFYAYENPIPLDNLSLKDIESLHTVVYDEDRIPHLDVIDSTAQALQITCLWHSKPCAFLFRRMRGVRPIDWFHALQQANLQLAKP